MGYKTKKRSVTSLEMYSVKSCANRRFFSLTVILESFKHWVHIAKIVFSFKSNSSNIYSLDITENEKIRPRSNGNNQKVRESPAKIEVWNIPLSIHRLFGGQWPLRFTQKLKEKRRCVNGVPTSHHYRTCLHFRATRESTIHYSSAYAKWPVWFNLA